MILLKAIQSLQKLQVAVMKEERRFLVDFTVTG
jgi:hypothetical protein